MMKRLFIYILTIASIVACSDNDSFSTSSNNVLTFGVDTLKMDTVFSSIPSRTYSFWVYNNSSDGIRISSVRLQRGNQTGFKVNVDGTYLDNTMGSMATDFEVRKGDSLRVFVELTSGTNGENVPKEVSDNLVFSLESGVQQSVVLQSWAWDAILCDSIIVRRDTIISNDKPIVIRNGIRVDSAATLTIYAPAKLYFSSNAGIDVYGRLVIWSNGEDVVMRGDRLDHMFDYLPYDRVSGQWRGIHIHPSSTGNDITGLDLHSSNYGIVVDSAAYDSTCYRLDLKYSSVYNCNGPGVRTTNANIRIANTLIANTLGDCLAVYGGSAAVIYSTLAQYYYFSGSRGVAARFTNYSGKYDIPLRQFYCVNSIITGYSADEIMGEVKDTTVAFGYVFENSIIRTPAPVYESVEDSVIQSKVYKNIIWESPTDTVQGVQHFRLIDETNIAYDFHLDSVSTARGRAVALPILDDRDRIARGDAPDIGCYQYVAPQR